MSDQNSAIIRGWIPGVEGAVLAVIAFILILRFADTQRTPVFCLLTAYISWFLAFSIIFLIPLDIYLVSTPFFLKDNSFDLNKYLTPSPMTCFMSL